MGLLAYAATVAAAVRLFAFADPSLTEASGIAPLGAAGAPYAVIEDSGNPPRIDVVDARGRTVYVVDVVGARNVDWEDVAAAPGPDGHPALWIADIGDNRARRGTITVYVVPRPARGGSVPLLATYRLRYPDGAHDAETLLVDPSTRRMYVVTKQITGDSGLYAAPAHPRQGAVTPLSRVGSLHLGLAGLATGGAISADGTRIVVRTYTQAYIWHRVGDVAASLRQAPTVIPLPRQPQGEGVTFVRGRLVIDSEGEGSDVYAVALPGPAAATNKPKATAPQAVRRTGSDSTRWPLVLTAALVAVVTATVVALRRRR